VLITGSLMLAVYTIVQAAERGWSSATTLVLGAVAAGLLVAFVAREATAKHPLVPLRIFRSRNVSTANAVQALMIAGMMGMFFLGALYLQRVLGYGSIEVGLAFLPVALSIGFLSVQLAPKLIVRFGGKATLVPGLLSMALGLAWFQRVPVDATYLVDLFPGDAAARRRRGPVVPVADDARHVRRIARGRGPGLRAWSTRPSRSAARSAWPCSPRCRRPAARTCSPAARRPRRR
jgi:hypothetical protein